uniref:Uncharacterized protein n=1 Tax=Geospiza parvula TaxID=87175 RepID=A0A8C3MFK1_GEOPR
WDPPNSESPNWDPPNWDPPNWDPSPKLGGPPPSPPRPPQVGEGQDVLARWTDGLLYLGVVKKVDAPRRGCLIQFEDNSQFFVLWKDISPAAVPGDDPSCCVCAGNSRNPENSLVRCGKCGHAYHQRCHVPPAPGGAAPWSCRRCVFAVATKRGGALRRGPQARALAALDWDPPHLHNLQHCYCYCGGPGHWNLKMLQCRRCRQWFHEACTQCAGAAALTGDRFYVFECSVCRGGAESVRRLPLRWVDVAHLLLYHLSVCCKRKYFDLEREILPFANSNWDALRLGTVGSKTGPKPGVLGKMGKQKNWGGKSEFFGEKNLIFLGKNIAMLEEKISNFGGKKSRFWEPRAQRKMGQKPKFWEKWGNKKIRGKNRIFWGEKIAILGGKQELLEKKFLIFVGKIAIFWGEKI